MSHRNRSGVSAALVPPSARDIVPRLPTGPGVYRFHDAVNRVLYIGRAVNLRRRVASYWTNPGHLADMVRRIDRIAAVSCRSEHEAAWLERNLLEQGLPRWNRTAGGQEVSVLIRLDCHSAAPGVAVVHSLEPVPGSRYFGPYLGGGKVRLAVAAIRRVLPVAFSGEALSGSEYDMARRRGVDPTTRSALVDTIASVLQRDGAAIAAVRAELVSRREAAADGLDFERAARVQAEMDGFEWVVAEQEVTRLDASHFDVCGWSAGILVDFQVRGGRLCSWTQRACTEHAAQPRLASTPSAWLDFGRRNAQLAARLTAPSASV